MVPKEPSPKTIKNVDPGVMRKPILLILFLILTAAAVSFASVSAQDIDISNMDNAQLLQLLQAIMQKLEASDDSAAETIDSDVPSESAAAMIPADDYETVKFSIWKNKKLMVEALPGYMFVQQKQDTPEEEPDPGKNQNPPNLPEHYENEPGTDEYGSPCHWALYNGKWYCMKG